MTQIAVLSGIALWMTVGVYGLVGCIVKLDDAGLYLSLKGGDSAALRFQRSLGRAILKAAPYLMKGLSVAGTVAMFLVGGGILTHGVPALHHLIERWSHLAGTTVQPIASMALDGVTGLAAGAIVLLGYTGIRRILGKS
jgi:predicted DNA repair protein MutK